MAEWIERRKLFTLYHVLNTIEEEKKYENFYKWFSNDVEKNTELLASAWIYGYTVEKEPLYTVEIPDPHGIYKIRYLFRNSEGNIRIGGSDCRDMLLNVETHLTESEIRKDFEWAWKWAKEVE